MAYEEAKLTGSFNAVMVPLEELHELPDNPRRGDVEAVRKSYARFGQRKPVVARHDSEGNLTVIAGNHQLKAARLLGWSELAVSIADDLSEDEAKAFALADNRTAELGTYDNEALTAAVSLLSQSPELLDAAGYSEDDLAKMLSATDEQVPDFEPVGIEDQPRLDQLAPTMCPQCAFEWRVGPKGEIEPV